MSCGLFEEIAMSNNRNPFFRSSDNSQSNIINSTQIPKMNIPWKLKNQEIQIVLTGDLVITIDLFITIVYVRGAAQKYVRVF